MDGISDNKENKFYFRCKDQPKLAGTDRESDRNINTEDLFEDQGGFTILGTQELVIDDVGPEGIIRDSAQRVEVKLTAKTSAGYNEGEATCFSSIAGADRYAPFLNTESYEHSTDLFLPEGDYEYDILCRDLGGNYDTSQINFTVESDAEPPLVVRVYKEENFLKIITDEVAECVYDTVGSSYLFDDGVPMTGSEEDHFVEWDTKKKFYIKCRDEYGNQPSPDQASIVVIPLE